MFESKQYGIFCLVVAIALWSCTGLFVKHFSFQNMDGDVQNLLRYAAAATGLWLFVLTVFGQEVLPALRRWWTFILPAAFNCLFQLFMVQGLYHQTIYPGLTALLSNSASVFAVVLAYVIYRDERRTIRTRLYLAGAWLAIIGVVGVILCGQFKVGDFNRGVGLIIVSSFFWACYTLAMKHVIRDTRPLMAFTMVATYTSGFFFVATVLRGDPSQFIGMGHRDQLLVILSGLACISVAHSLYFRAVERLGVAVCASFSLVLPLITGILSAFFLNERLSAGQIVMGGVLLVGAYLVVRAAQRPRQEQPAYRMPRATTNGRLLLSCIPLLALAGFGYGHFVEAKWLRVRTVKLASNGHVRFVQISDIHFTGDSAYLEAVVTRVNALKPQFVCFTGDLVETADCLPRAVEILKGIRAPLYAVPGNWDYAAHADFAALRHLCDSTGGAFLVNESIRLKPDLTLVGLDDQLCGEPNVERAFAGVAGGGQVALMTHCPMTIDLIASRRVTIALTGHSHGGQVRMPLIGSVIVPPDVGDYDRGLYATPVGYLYVNPGIGASLLRARFMCRPEITLFKM